jgi:DNA-binding IclR family transcriptional regulator
MHLDPITPVDTTGTQAPSERHGACGSDARLKILLLLAKRPLGLKRGAIAQAIGLDEQTTLYVLTALRVQSGLVACDKRSHDSTWFSPNARAELGPAGLRRLAEEAEREAAAAAATARGTA